MNSTDPLLDVALSDGNLARPEVTFKSDAMRRRRLAVLEKELRRLAKKANKRPRKLARKK
jgi:hypothetical protein